MMRYWLQTRDQIFVKGYGFLCFAKNMDKNVGKNIIKNLSGKYSQKRLDHPKKFTIDTFKTASKTKFKNSRSNWWFNWWQNC